MTESSGRPFGGDVHRLLDEAFTGIDMTPESQDLKEEIRGNLLARAAELETAGQPPADAARNAIAELGDLHELLDAPGSVPLPERVGWDAAFQQHRVRPKPAFVVGAVVAALAATIALLLATLGATAVLLLPIGVVIGMLGVGASGAAWIVGDSLAHETTTNHPMPSNRAGGYFLATFLSVYGLGFGGLVALGALPVWAVVFAALGVVAGIILFAFLGATQTNRHKAWVRAMGRELPARPNRFDEEPETAARFGIYTMVIWVAAFAVFVVLSFTIGWAWSWLALLGGFVVMMVTLARMLFRAR